jgi:hypothetical protein
MPPIHGVVIGDDGLPISAQSVPGFVGYVRVPPAFGDLIDRQILSVLEQQGLANMPPPPAPLVSSPPEHLRL